MPQVELRAVRREERALLAELVEQYCVELGPYFGVQPGADGRYGYPGLARYWDEPDDRFAFLICVDGELAGFALATRGSPATHDARDLDVAEFFVLPAFRRSGIGGKAASLLWDRVPGHWIVRAAVQNAAAVLFWRRIIAAYSGGSYSERTLVLRGVTRQVFALDSRSKA
jgi:predicted acetyltransferase